MQKELIGKLNDGSAVIGIVGLGYVGLPLMLRYIEVGYAVLGFDIDANKVAKLNKGETYIGHIADERIASARAHGFEATADFERAGEADALILCVPTPLDEHLEPDLSYVVDTVDMLTPYMRAGQVVSLESTTYPGTTDEELMPRIEAAGFKVGADSFLVYSPEREDPGNPDFTTRTIPKVCGGGTPACREVGEALYGRVIDTVVPVSSTRAAEMVKLLENIHRAVNIGLVNEMKVVADRMGIDIFEVIQAAATKPFGFVPYYPGPGLGGHCIPIDPFYLTWKAKEYGIRTHFIELAGEVNRSMPAYVVGRAADALNSHRKALNGSRVLVLGMAYKRDVDDSRESPSAELLARLHEKGAYIDYSDPHIAAFPEKRDYDFDLESVELTAENIRSYDCLILATNHTAFDYELIKENAPLIIDTRGVYKEDKVKVFRA